MIKISSVKHEYEGTWSESTRLTTCDPHAKKTVTGSNALQEVGDKQEIIFTYDVDFQVYMIMRMLYSSGISHLGHVV